MHLQGFRVRIKINGRAFAVRRFSLTDEVPDVDVTNVEGVDDWNADGSPVVRAFQVVEPAGKYARSTPGPRKATIELEQATLIQHANSNPFLHHFALESGVNYKVEIYPNRGLIDRHLFPLAMVTKISHAGEVSALQPVTMTLVSHGPYKLYTILANL